MTKQSLYQCPECGLHYTDQETAKQCQAWCKGHKSCNLEITQHSVEAKQGMSTPARNDAHAQLHKRRDLLHTSSALWLWCLPILILILANNLYINHRLSFTVAGILITIATFWIGMACYANGRSCGRLHCKMDGIVLPLLSLIGLLNLLHVTSFSWGMYSNALLVIVILSFVAEWVDNRVHHRGRGGAIC